MSDLRIPRGPPAGIGVGRTQEQTPVSAETPKGAEAPVRRDASQWSGSVRKAQLQLSPEEIRATAFDVLAQPLGPRDGPRIALTGGWVARKLDAAAFAQRTGDNTNVAHGFVASDPAGHQTFAVKSGFADAYLKTTFPETLGQDAAWFLGPPKENEHEEKLPGTEEVRTVQRFERGMLTWTAAQGVQLMPTKVPPPEVRYRFAPSPTGHLHIGGAYVALKNFMAAERAGGKFFLRIEDTDTARSKEEYTRAIKTGLDWIGVKYEPEVEHQSARTKLYNERIDKLIADGRAYVGDGGAVYFRMPTQGKIVVNDVLRGGVTFEVSKAGGLKDYAIRRSDGMATFLLANTVDDGEQGITHVIRGVDHLTNAARQVPLFEALGYRPPEFYHVPLIHGDDGAKLSKRHGATSVMDFQREGFSPDVLVNHLARLGFGFDTDESLALNQLIEEFDPARIGKSKSQIGYDALYARNRTHMAQMRPAELLAELNRRASELEVPFDDGTVKTFAEVLGPRGMEALAEASAGRASTFQEAIDLGMLTLAPPDMLKSDVEKQTTPERLAVMRDFAAKMNALPEDEWSTPGLAESQSSLSKDDRSTLRWMLTGGYEGFPLDAVMAMLGKAETLQRIRAWTAN